MASGCMGRRPGHRSYIKHRQEALRVPGTGSSAAGAGGADASDAGGRALSLALLATIQAAAEAADADAVTPLPAEVIPRSSALDNGRHFV